MHWKYVVGSLVVLYTFGAIAEPYLVIHKSDGFTVRIPIAGITKIDFDLKGSGTKALKNIAVFKQVAAVIKTGKNVANIEYSLKKSGFVAVEIFGLNGKLVRVLTSGVEPAGTHRVSWNFLQESGKRVVSGSYIARVRIDGVPFSRSLCIVQ